jgi:hypothetical protein
MAEKQAEAQRQMEESIAKEMARREEGFRLERSAMDEDFKAKEKELAQKAEELKSVRRNSVDIGKFAQLELELDKIPAMEREVEELKEAKVRASPASPASAVIELFGQLLLRASPAQPCASHVRPCKLAGCRGGSGGLPPTAPSVTRFCRN